MAKGVVAGVRVGGPRLQILAADDVDYAAYGIRAIECRRGAFHYLDAAHVVEVHAVVVRVVHRLARHALAIDEEEDGVAAETTHVERCLLAHGEAELQSGNLLRQHVLDVGSISDLDVVEADESRHDGCIFQGLG